MSKEYSCELCKKIFNRKNDFTKHQNKKTSCITNNIKSIKIDNKTELINIFKSCLNILRDNEGLTGEKALKNLSYFLILKLIEPHFDSHINIDDYEYDFSHLHDELIDEHKKTLLSIVRFSKLTQENEDNIPSNMKHLWDDILSIHPTTKNIFLQDKGFDIQHKSTYKKLINKINSIDLLNSEEDILGNAYEEVIQDIMTGKVLGQFFTPPVIKKMMIKLINPQIHNDGTIDTCCDPTMGTGGFLITYLQYILQQAKTKKIKPNWDFIKTTGLYGKELDHDTFQMAVSNMLISSGHIFDKLDRGDSIREPIKGKFDNILANPPFGIKGFKYDDFYSPLKSEYIPIKTDKAVSLFIQAIIYLLKINGKCAVVLPDGQELFSKSNTTLVAVREYLMKSCDLQEIIYLESGIFTYTPIKTCVFYFEKRKERIDVLEVKINMSKTKKEISRDYIFPDVYQTSKVKFYEYNHIEDIKKLLVEVPIEKIANNSYSLNYAEYMKDNSKEQYEDGIVVKTLGEIFNCKMGKFNSNDMDGNGIIPFYSCKSNNPVGFHSVYSFDYPEYLLLVGAGGSQNNIIGDAVGLGKCYYVNGKTACRANVCSLISKTQEYNIKYINYYLNINRIETNKKAHFTTNLGTISLDDIKSIEIPIPSLGRQQEIVKYLDFIYEKTNKTSNEKIKELKQLNEYCLNNQKIYGKNKMKILEDVCNINYGTRIVKENNNNGEYHVYGSGRAMFSTDTFNREGYNILIGRFALSLECVRFINDKIFLNDSGLSVKPKTDILLHKYIGYYLIHNQSIIYNCARGTAQKNLEMDIFKSLLIPIPSLECQKEIVDYCEANDNLIKQLEKEIETNKKLAQQFITNIVNVEVEELDNTNSIISDDDKEVIEVIKTKVKKEKKHNIVIEDNTI